MWSKAIFSVFTIAGLVADVLAGPTKKIVNADAPNRVPDQYMVVFKKGTTESAIARHHAKMTSFQEKRDLETRGHRRHGRGKKSSFRFKGLCGYVANYTRESVTAAANSQEVDYIEQDVNIKLSSVEWSSPWGLDRLSHSNYQIQADILGTGYTYQYDGTTNGKGVTVYVIDTGILTTHNEFKNPDGTSRASWGTNTIDSVNTDGNGHGTHCAGIVGGNTWGVVKAAKVVAVKVLDSSGSGTWTSVLNGMNWVAANAKPNLSVVSMSLGGSYSPTVNSAINTLWNAGVISAVAAGNEGVDAAGDSPASAPQAITVGAIDNTNLIPSWSNFGSVVDLYAPGVEVQSSFIGSNSATAILSGTSMATPHVAGVAAYYISTHGGSAGLSPQSTTNSLINNALTRILRGSLAQLRNSNNRILFNGCSSACASL
ncbi:Cerevisin [Arthrobotrys entomopaga]|nr:Cerevisin [Arthrobotrys entomopaga]